MAAQPTRGADAETVERWRSRPGLARLIRLAVLLLPPLVSGVGTWQLRGLFWHVGGVVGWVAWMVQLSAVGVVLALVTERVVRRMLPLSQLLRFSLVFPDKAPSRYGVALRTGTLRQQQEVIDRVRDHGFSADEVESFRQLVVLVMALGRHERLTRGHTERVRAYSDLIGAELGLAPADREKLHWAALLHDIGKLAVPAELLSLPGRPNDAQWEIIKQHPAIGARMVEPFAGWLGEWRRAAGDHHERWDGGGYPNGSSGLDISLAGRIVAVADAYDVITSSRSYKQAMSPEAARAELVRCAGAQFDPAVVRAMLRVSTGDLRNAGGRFGWVGALQGVTSSIGQGILLPLTAAAGILGVPILAGGVGLADELDPFALLAPGRTAVADAEADNSDPSDSADEAGRGGSDDGGAGDRDGGDGGSDDGTSPGVTPTPSRPGGEEPSTTATPAPTPTPTVPGIDVPPLPTVGLPLPTVGLPLPTVGLPLPTVKIPPLPTVQVPTVQLPTVQVPTVRPPVDLPLPTPTVSVPALPTPTVVLPTVTVPPLPTVPKLPGG